MRIALTVAISLGIVSGLSMAHAIESSIKPRVSATQEPFAHDSRASSETSHSSVDRPKLLYQSTDPDCEGKSPSSRHVTTLLSKFAHSSSKAGDAQCTEFSTSDHPVEETH